MRTFKTILMSGIVILSLALNGCTLFPGNKTRPAPVRPKATIKKRVIGPVETLNPIKVKATPKITVSPMKSPKMKTSPMIKTTPAKTAKRTVTGLR